MSVDFISIFWIVGLTLFPPFYRRLNSIHWSLNFIWMYAVVATYFPRRFEFPLALSAALSHGAAMVCVLTLFFLILMEISISKKKLRKWLSVLATTGALVSFFCAALRFTIGFEWAGLVGNKAMNGALLALLIPFAPEISIGAFVVPILLVADIILAGCATPYITLGAMYVGYLLTSPTHSTKLKGWMMACGGVLTTAAALLMGTGSHLEDRIEMWEALWGHVTLPNLFLGYGPGSYRVLPIYWQWTEKLNLSNGLYTYAHSDLIQAVFEYGGMGLLIFALGYVHLLRRAYSDRDLFSVLLGFLGLSCLYYPFHFPNHLFLFFIIVKMVLSNDTKPPHVTPHILVAEKCCPSSDWECPVCREKVRDLKVHFKKQHDTGMVKI